MVDCRRIFCGASNGATNFNLVFFVSMRYLKKAVKIKYLILTILMRSTKFNLIIIQNQNHHFAVYGLLHIRYGVLCF